MRPLLLLVALLGYGGNPEHEGPPSPVDTVLTWLGALRDGRASPLARFTAFPFTYREGWASKQCSRTVDSADTVGAWIDCTHERDGRLIEALHEAAKDPGRAHLVLGDGGASKKLRGMVPAAARRSTWISGRLRGDHATYDLLFAVSGNDVKGRRISGLFIDSSAER